MPKEKELIKNLLDLYEKHVFELPIGILGHFFARYYSVTGDDKHKKTMALNIFVKYYSKFERSSKEFLKNDSFGKKSKGPTPKTERKKARFDFYQKNVKARFLDDFLLMLFYINKHGLEKNISQKDYNRVLSKLSKFEFDSLYNNDDAIRADSSYLFNSVFFLKHLGIDSKISKDCEKRLKAMYLDSKIDLAKISDDEYKSFVYSMTHIIIADSKFYERFVSGHKWIINYFVNNLPTIVKRTTPDIVAEVGFCLRLCREDKNHRDFMKRVKDFSLRSMKWGLLRKDIEFLRWKEHTNSILIMLFAKNKKFYKPLNFSNNKLFK